MLRFAMLLPSMAWWLILSILLMSCFAVPDWMVSPRQPGGASWDTSPTLTWDMPAYALQGASGHTEVMGTLG